MGHTKASGFALNFEPALDLEGLARSGPERRAAVHPPAERGRSGNPARWGRAAGARLGRGGPHSHNAPCVNTALGASSRRLGGAQQTRARPEGYQAGPGCWGAAGSHGGVGACSGKSPAGADSCRVLDGEAPGRGGASRSGAGGLASRGGWRGRTATSLVTPGLCRLLSAPAPRAFAGKLLGGSCRVRGFVTLPARFLRPAKREPVSRLERDRGLESLRPPHGPGSSPSAPGPQDSLPLRDQLVRSLRCLARSFSRALLLQTSVLGSQPQAEVRLASSPWGQVLLRGVVAGFCLWSCAISLPLPLPQSSPFRECQDTELGVGRILGMESGNYFSHNSALSCPV